MLLNQNLTITGDSVALVPYRTEHVETYHNWMKNEELRVLTASDPLSLEQEYEMQQTWLHDDDKCTFILLDTSLPGPHGGAMAGDVNLFWNEHDDDNVVEIEVMVAEKCSQRKGIAREALKLLMAFAISKKGVCGFIAKINEGNLPSIMLFGQLGFVKHKEVAVFSEIHFLLDSARNADAWGALVALGKNLQYGVYDTGEEALVEPP